MTISNLPQKLTIFAPDDLAVSSYKSIIRRTYNHIDIYNNSNIDSNKDDFCNSVIFIMTGEVDS